MAIPAGSLKIAARLVVGLARSDERRGELAHWRASLVWEAMEWSGLGSAIDRRDPPTARG